MSILPRRLEPGGQVTIHLGLVNRSDHPIFPFVRVNVVDPKGKYYPLFAEHVLVFPNWSPGHSRSAQRSRAHNLYFSFAVAADAELGRYRVKVENFNSGRLWLSEDAANDFFFVEALHFEALQSDGRCYRCWVTNPSLEAVVLRIFEQLEGPGSRFCARETSLAPGQRQELVLHSDPAFVQYAGNKNVLLSSADSPLVLRNQRFFWRDEDEQTVYVFDPRAERKRSFFLSQQARELWHRSNGVARRCDLVADENAEQYDLMVQKKLIQEINL